MFKSLWRGLLGEIPISTIFPFILQKKKCLKNIFVQNHQIKISKLKKFEIFNISDFRNFRIFRFSKFSDFFLEKYFLKNKKIILRTPFGSDCGRLDRDNYLPAEQPTEQPTEKPTLRPRTAD